MNYELFPIPNVYYVSVYNDSDTEYTTMSTFRTINVTNITIPELKYGASFKVSVSAYVPCSGLHVQCTNSQGECSCGLPAYHTIIVPPTITCDKTNTTPMTTNVTTETRLSIFYFIVLPATVAILVITLTLVLIIGLILRNREMIEAREEDKEKGSPEDKSDPGAERGACVFVLYPYDII